MGTLYIVATPIGNLEDITNRAVRVLQEVSVIACEDTRVTRTLLNRYNITTPVISYHQHSKLSRVDEIVERLKAGESVAAVSDAGTPGVADPGGVLVAAAVAAGVTVSPIPGPSAIMAAASVTGWPMDRFLFYGFLPHKKGRATGLRVIASSEVPVILYESTHRIMKLLDELLTVCGDCQIVVAREITKQFETIHRGRVSDVQRDMKETRGEFVVIIDPSTKA